MNQERNTVNSLMFAGINVCVFETNPCLRGLIFAISSGLTGYLGTWIMFAGYLFLRFKDGREIRQINPSQTLMNLQYCLHWYCGRSNTIPNNYRYTKKLVLHLTCGAASATGGESAGNNKVWLWEYLAYVQLEITRCGCENTWHMYTGAGFTKIHIQ